MIVTHPMCVKLICEAGSAAEIALQPPQPFTTKGVAIARPIRMIRN